jgi:tetratricopeptide (TPR) repeat protein
MPTRAEMLRTFIAQSPRDPFPRYGLAQELKNTGDLSGAWSEFSSLLEAFPDYVPAYLHAGNTLVALGRQAEARDVYTRGLSVCRQVGDMKTLGEIQSALDSV